MKKRLFMLALGFGLVANLTAQESTDFNKWSVDVGFGVNKPLRPLASGYSTSTPNFVGANLGVRYMFNSKFGIKADGSYENFTESKDSNEFRSDYLRGSLQGIANLGRIFEFESFSSKLGLLAHAGGGISVLATQEPINRGFNKGGDFMLNFIAGLTPQYKLSNKVALFADVSVIAHARQSLTFDGTRKTTTRGIDGALMTASVGLNVYLGKSAEHADWAIVADTMQNELDALEEKVADIEDKMKDSDGDGVADYLDKESSAAGVAVDARGVAVDKNGNNIPDELESSLDARYAAKNDMPSGSTVVDGGDIIEQLINGGFVNVYFKFGSAQPEVYSYEAMNYLAQYLKDNPNASAELIGYADEIGAQRANQRLSERRAKRVYDILVASGISASRLTATGAGEDASVDKNSEAARQLVRRVTFKLK